MQRQQVNRYETRKKEIYLLTKLPLRYLYCGIIDVIAWSTQKEKVPTTEQHAAHGSSEADSAGPGSRDRSSVSSVIAQQRRPQTLQWTGPPQKQLLMHYQCY